MKKMIIILLAVLGISLIYLIIKGNTVKEIKTEIDISAAPSKVWEIITDIDNWQEWSPIINVSNGTSAMGAKLEITMKGKKPGKNGPTYNPVITELIEPNYFHWRTQMLAGFVFTNDKIFKLEKTESGTHLTHIETFKGLMAPLVSSSLNEHVPMMLDSMNSALKERAER